MVFNQKKGNGRHYASLGFGVTGHGAWGIE
jgi:hypothetical protein